MTGLDNDPHRGIRVEQRYYLELLFGEAGGCIWATRDATREQFGDGPLDRRLPLSPETLGRVSALAARFETSFDFGIEGYGPWSPEQAARFRHRVEGLLPILRAELGAIFIIESTGA